MVYSVMPQKNHKLSVDCLQQQVEVLCSCFNKHFRSFHLCRQVRWFSRRTVGRWSWGKTWDQWPFSSSCQGRSWSRCRDCAPWSECPAPGWSEPCEDASVPLPLLAVSLRAHESPHEVLRFLSAVCHRQHITQHCSVYAACAVDARCWAFRPFVSSPSPLDVLPLDLKKEKN